MWKEAVQGVVGDWVGLTQEVGGCGEKWVCLGQERGEGAKAAREREPC